SPCAAVRSGAARVADEEPVRRRDLHRLPDRHPAKRVAGPRNGRYIIRIRPTARRFAVPPADPTRSPEELARLGAEVFARQVRPALRREDDGKCVAIDVTTGDFEIDEDDYAAVTRLRARRPTADVWLERAGQPTAYQMRYDR